MAKYQVCPRCNGKGYTLESNIVDDGLFGIFFDIFDGFNKIRCNLCCGCGRIRIED